MPVGDGTMTVGAVTAEFSRRYEKREGKPIAVTELQTKSGDSLDPSDPIADVVDDGAELVAITSGPESGRAAAAATVAAAAPIAVVDAVEVAKAAADEAARREAEAVLQCVQCGKSYRESENGDGHCRFHSAAAERRGWRTSYGCCGGDTPCKGGRHRSAHHTDYPYAGFFEWAARTQQLIAARWLNVSRQDFADGYVKSASVGVLKDGRLFLRCFRGTGMRFFAVLERADVVAGARAAGGASKRTTAIHRWVDTATPDSFVEFFWDANDVADGAACVGVTLKLGSDAVPTVRRVRFSVSADAAAEAAFKMLDVQTLSDRPGYAFPTEEQVAACRAHFGKAPVRTGPEIAPDVAHEKTVYPCEGDSVLRMEQAAGREPEANQSMWARDGKFEQYVIAVVTVTNPTDQEVAIASVSAEYKLGAAFTPAEKTFLGVPNARGGHFFPEGGFETMRLKPHDAATVSLSAMVHVEGEPGNRNETRWRAAPGLPQPLKVRYVLHDADGKAVSLVVEQTNKPLQLATKESQQESWKREIVGWFACDDVSRLERAYVAFYLDGRGDLVVRFPGRYFFLTEGTLAYTVYRARKANTAEFEMEDIKSDGASINALVDIAGGFVWGFRVLIKTKTSSLEDTFSFPDMAAVRAQFSVAVVEPAAKGEAVKPGAQFTASWSMLCGNCDGRILLCNAELEDDSDAQVSYKDIKEKQGTVQIAAPTKPGTYNLRLIAQSTYESLARSATFVVA